MHGNGIRASKACVCVCVEGGNYGVSQEKERNYKRSGRKSQGHMRCSQEIVLASDRSGDWFHLVN